MPSDWVKGAKDTLSEPDNVTLLLLAGGASVAMNQGADDKIADNFRDKQIFGDYSDKLFDVCGGPLFHLGAASLWYALSADNLDEVNKQRAWTMIKAITVTGWGTMGLKAIRDDENPNGNRWAWPSGHTSSSFAVASVLDEFYGPEVGIPAYALASLVGLRMMDSGEHWGSDVVFGAALGWAVGHTIAGKDRDIEVAGFKVQPFTASGNESVIGLNLLKWF